MIQRFSWLDDQCSTRSNEKKIRRRLVMYRQNEKSEEARCSKLGREWKDDKKSTGLSESLAMSSVIIQQRVFSFFFIESLMKKKFLRCEFYGFFSSKRLILKKRKEEEKKNKKKIHKERAAVFRIVKRISVIETRNVWCCCVEEGQRVLYAKTEILFRTNKLQRVFTRDFFPADKIFTKKNERVFELMID